MEYAVVLIVLIVVAVLEATLLAIMGKKRKGYAFAVVGAFVGFIVHSLYSIQIRQSVLYAMCGVVVLQSVLLFNVIFKKAVSVNDCGSLAEFNITED